MHKFSNHFNAGQIAGKLVFLALDRVFFRLYWGRWYSYPQQAQLSSNRKATIIILGSAAELLLCYLRIFYQFLDFYRIALQEIPKCYVFQNYCHKFKASRILITYLVFKGLAKVL